MYRATITVTAETVSKYTVIEAEELPPVLTELAASVVDPEAVPTENEVLYGLLLNNEYNAVEFTITHIF